MLYILQNVVAGSDTVATAVNDIFNLNVRSPCVYKRLTEDIVWCRQTVAQIVRVGS